MKTDKRKEIVKKLGLKNWEKYKKAITYLNKKEKILKKRKKTIINKSRYNKISLKYVPSRKTAQRRIKFAEKLKKEIKKGKSFENVINQLERKQIKINIESVFLNGESLDSGSELGAYLEVLSDEEYKGFFDSTYGRDIERLQYANYREGEIASMEGIKKEFNIKNIDIDSITEYIKSWVYNNCSENRVVEIEGKVNDLRLGNKY